MQGWDHDVYNWLTPSRVRVLRELADDRTEREVAERLGVAYSSVRSAVQVLKHRTGCENVRDLPAVVAREPRAVGRVAPRTGRCEHKRYVR